MVDRSSPAAARTFGTLLLIFAACALAIALWKQFGVDADATNLFIAAALLATSGLLVRKDRRHHEGDHAR
ncbi:MAG: hypothetical protein EOP58_16795 [Sphingomonadales bacterium]|nr:MAG: hypothetical protein EOP58_16795 [Sphingomonadales bacterium]